MKVLVDTNVIIDGLQNRGDFAKDAGKIILSAPEYGGHIAASSVTDIYYLQHRYYRDNKKTKRSLEKVLTLFDILDTTAADCRNALRSSIPDFEDAVLAESALREGIDCIVTRNAKDFKNSGITVYSPAEFLDKFQKDSH